MMLRYDAYPPQSPTDVHFTPSALMLLHEANGNVTTGEKALAVLGRDTAGDLLGAFPDSDPEEWPSTSAKMVEYALTALKEVTEIDIDRLDFGGDTEKYAAFLGGIVSELSEYIHPWVQDKEVRG